jgi:hypothetical protein
MPVVDVDSIASKDKPELVDEALSGSLNAQYSFDLETVVTHSFSMIDFWKCQNCLESHAVRLNDPVVITLVLLASLTVVV